SWLNFIGIDDSLLKDHFRALGPSFVLEKLALSAELAFSIKMKLFCDSVIQPNLFVVVCSFVCSFLTLDFLGLLCVSFPLHPPGQFSTVRSSEYCPMFLCVCNSERHVQLSKCASLECRCELLESIVVKMASPSGVHWVEGGQPWSDSQGEIQRVCAGCTRIQQHL
uniref:Uncharacterized protein n=1 Tax=Electrophorus electricus TaxID=8005 RepID=A0AAY5EWC1_ELEEL